MQPERGLRGLSMPFRPGLPLDVIIKKVNPASSPRGALAIWEALVPEGSAERKPSTSQSGWQTFPIHGTYEEGVAWIVAMLAEALAYSHIKGILHRDVKPANVLLTLGNGPQLLDFNLAHDPHSADQARAALRGGTLPYMAPEQLDAYHRPRTLGRGGSRRGVVFARAPDARVADRRASRGPRPETPPCSGDPRVARPQGRTSGLAPTPEPGRPARPRGDRRALLDVRARGSLSRREGPGR